MYLLGYFSCKWSDIPFTLIYIKSTFSSRYVKVYLVVNLSVTFQSFPSPFSISLHPLHIGSFSTVTHHLSILPLLSVTLPTSLSSKGQVVTEGTFHGKSKTFPKNLLCSKMYFLNLLHHVDRQSRLIVNTRRPFLRTYDLSLLPTALLGSRNPTFLSVSPRRFPTRYRQLCVGGAPCRPDCYWYSFELRYSYSFYNTP